MKFKDLKKLVADLNYGKISPASFLLQVQLDETQHEILKSVVALPHGVGININLADLDPK